MNRVLQNRLAKLEEAQAGQGVHYTISDKPLSDAEWERGADGGSTAEAHKEAGLSPLMTEAEWEREFCRDGRT